MARKTRNALDVVERKCQRFANHVAAAMSSRDPRNERLTID
jgi:hypothetical protein